MIEAPKHLSEAAKAWWNELQGEYPISDSGGRLLLQTALEAFDRMKSAAAEIDRDGETIKDRFDQVKAHPALVAEKDARSQMLAALKQLRLDIEPVRDGPGRPTR